MATLDKEIEIVMVKGETGGVIDRLEKTATVGNVDTYTIFMADGSTYTFNVTNGSNISTIEKTATVGKVDTYTITLTNGDTSTFTVTNGEVSQNDLDNAVNGLQTDISSLQDDISSLSSKKLYRHDIQIDHDSINNHYINFTIFNTSDTLITFSNLYSFLANKVNATGVWISSDVRDIYSSGTTLYVGYMSSGTYTTTMIIPSDYSISDVCTQIF